MENANEANPNEEVNINEPSTSSAGPSKKRKRRSTAWDHFHIVSGTLNENPVDFAHCNYCTTKYQYSGKGINGSTGNLNSHTKKKHPERLNGAENLENNAEFVFSQENYRKAVLKRIVERNQFINEPQQTAFLEVVRSLNPFAEELTLVALQQDLIELYTKNSSSVKVKLGQVPGKLSFTITNTLLDDHLFLKVEAHWIDNWKIESEVLDFYSIPDQNSMSNVCDFFVCCLSQNEIPLSKILGITLQNVSDNQAFIDSLHNKGLGSNLNISLAGNLVESLQNVVDSAVQALLSHPLNQSKDHNKNLQLGGKKPNQSVSTEAETNKHTPIMKVRNLISTIKGSSGLLEELKEMCKLMGIELSLPVVDENVNSNFKMLESAVNLQQPLRALCIKLKALSEFMISEEEWEDINTLKKLLFKFHRGMDNVPIYSYLATFNWLIDSLESLSEDTDGFLSESITICLAKMKEFKIEMSHSKIPFIATILNPALKMVYFKEHNYSKPRMREIEREANEIFKKDYEMTGTPSADKSEEEEEDELFSHMFKREKTENFSKEFQKFLRYPVSSPKSEVLDFWKLNEPEFPRIAKMARDYLAVSSSITEFKKEKVDKEELLTSEHIRETLCLKHWLAKAD